MDNFNVSGMDCFTNVLATFLDLGTFQLCCCLCRVRELLDFIKNLCSKDERRYYSLDYIKLIKIIRIFHNITVFLIKLVQPW